MEQHEKGHMTKRGAGLYIPNVLKLSHLRGDREGAVGTRAGRCLPLGIESSSWTAVGGPEQEMEQDSLWEE